MTSTAPDIAGTRARTFTRVTVTGPHGAVDLAVPDDIQVPEFIRLVVGGMGADPTAAWALEHPVLGAIHEPETPGSLGIVDGDTLLLVPDRRAEGLVAVDDVSDTVAQAVSSSRAWTPEFARPAGAALLAAWLVGMTLFARWHLTYTASIAMAVAVTVVLVVLVQVARAQNATWVARWLALGAVLSGGLLGWRVADSSQWHKHPTWIAIAIAAAVAAALCRAGCRQVSAVTRPAIVLCGTLVEVVLASWVLTAWVHGAHHAAVLSVVLLLLVGTTTGLSTSLSGLQQLDNRLAAGEDVQERAVHERLAAARTDLVLMVGVLSAALAWQATELIADHHRATVVLGLALLVLALLRSRTYLSPRHALAAALPALLAAAVCAAVQASRGESVTVLFGVTAGVGVVLAIYALVTAPPVVGSRTRIVLDRFEGVLLVAVVPLVLWVFNAYVMAWQHLRH